MLGQIYIHQRAREAGDLRIDFDLIAETLGSEVKHDSKGLVRKAAFEAREGAIKTALKEPEAESWIIHTLPSAEALRAYEEAGAEIIRLDVPKEECIERAKADGRPEATFEAIEKYFAHEKGAKMEKHLGEKVKLGIRPENISVSPTDCTLKGTLKVQENLGSEAYVYIEYADTLLTAKVSTAVNKDSGHDIVFAIDPDKIHIFAYDSGENISI